MSSGQEVGEIFGEGSGPAAALLRSPTVIIASIALWGMNVYCFRIFKIDYIRVLLLDLKKEEEKDKEREREREQRSKRGKRQPKVRRGKDGAIRMEVSTSESMESVDISSKSDKNNSYGDLELEKTDSQVDGEDTNDMVVVPLESPSSLQNDPNKMSNDDYEITAMKLVGLSAFLMVTLHLTSVLWIKIANGSTIGAIFLFYTLVIIGILIPVPSTAWVRLSCKTIFGRAKELLNPRCSCFTRDPRPVPFIDVFFADAMCSMSKVFFDWGMLWVMASHYPHPVPPSAQTIIMPSCMASLPYIIRARQCLVMYNVGLRGNDPKRYQHVLNAIKYSTSLFPLIVSAFQKTETGQRIKKQLEFVLIFLLIVNASYSLLWDIMMDWGMMQNPSAVVEHTVGGCTGMTPMVPNNAPQSAHPTTCIDAALRPRLRFGAINSLLILILDTFLRFSWTLRFYEPLLFPSNGAYILCTEFLEVFRRAMWNLLRVEWEHIKQTKAEKMAAEEEDEIMMVEMNRNDSTSVESGIGGVISGESMVVARTATSRDQSPKRMT